MSRKRKQRPPPSTEAAGGDPLAATLARWLKSRGVVWSSARVATTREGVVAGYGCVALQPLRRGEELFRVPRAACLGATSAGADADVTDGDCQRRLALALLEATADWAPFLAMLTPARCPWVWSESERRLLDGTELEPVVEAKLRALAEEHASLPQAVAEACGAERYAELCALAASHANPWWGGCIAPFNTTLNWARRPNVSFEPRGSKWVVGVATRRIRAGEELTQAYGGATARPRHACLGCASDGSRAAPPDVPGAADLVGGPRLQVRLRPAPRR
ncbi:hypothetical protein EMIHUDRAFT_449359, partial [Emiliania huxleyi CCMP1516]|uniref:SET domain-containing protein n=2 Tax=Emiliania huxleyi TaxID=2903 RepID=A0A0D3KF63_EMIH1